MNKRHVGDLWMKASRWSSSGTRPSRHLPHSGSSPFNLPVRRITWSSFEDRYHPLIPQPRPHGRVSRHPRHATQEHLSNGSLYHSCVVIIPDQIVKPKRITARHQVTFKAVCRRVPQVWGQYRLQREKTLLSSKTTKYLSPRHDGHFGGYQRRQQRSHRLLGVQKTQ